MYTHIQFQNNPAVYFAKEIMIKSLAKADKRMTLLNQIIIQL